MRRLLLTSIFTVALATLAHGQAPLPFTTQDVLDVVRISVADMTDDGAFVVATLVTDRHRKNVDHMRFGDPTYISPSTGQLVVIDASDGSVEPIFDDREDRVWHGRARRQSRHWVALDSVEMRSPVEAMIELPAVSQPRFNMLLSTGRFRNASDAQQ